MPLGEVLQVKLKLRSLGLSLCMAGGWIACRASEIYQRLQWREA